MEAEIDIVRRVFAETLRYMQERINDLESNITSTQVRCSTLLSSNREQRKLIKELQARLAILNHGESGIGFDG